MLWNVKVFWKLITYKFKPAHMVVLTLCDDPLPSGIIWWYPLIGLYTRIFDMYVCDTIF